MAIATVEKICPRCQTRFFGRKNKVFCSEACKVDANNERLKQAYHLQHNINNPNKKNKENIIDYSDKINELKAQIRQLQEENKALKEDFHELEQRYIPYVEEEGRRLMALMENDPEIKALNTKLKKQRKPSGK